MIEPLVSSVRSLVDLLYVLPFGFWIGSSVLLGLPLLYLWWNKRLWERFDEMRDTANEIKLLASRGDDYKHLPIERTDFLRTEAYSYLVSCLFLMLFCLLGFLYGFHLIAEGWFSSTAIKLSSPEAISSFYVRRQRGIIFVIALMLLPFILWYVSFTVLNGLIKSSKNSFLLKSCKRYLSIDYRKRFRK